MSAQTITPAPAIAAVDRVERLIAVVDDLELLDSTIERLRPLVAAEDAGRLREAADTLNRLYEMIQSPPQPAPAKLVLVADLAQLLGKFLAEIDPERDAA